MTHRVNKKGRNTTEHWTKLTRSLMEEPAWRALRTTAQALYPWLKLEWHGPKANNNGRLRFSLRQAAERMGIHANTVGRAFHDLQAKGFIIVTERACLGTTGWARAPSYELTELALPHSEMPEGRKLYRDWRPGRDFNVVKHASNNAEGRNGKRKTPSSKWGQTYPRKSDVQANPVTEMKTARPRNGDVRPVPEQPNVIEMRTSLSTRHTGPEAVPDLSLAAAVELCPLLTAGGA